MTTDKGLAPQAPLYARVLRLRHLHIGGFVSFMLFECTVAAGVLLALAELVSWWAVPILPAVVAIMVKLNDLAVGGSRTRSQTRSAVRTTSSGRVTPARVELPMPEDNQAPVVTRRHVTPLERAEIARARDLVAARDSAAAGDSAAARDSAVARGSVGAPVDREWSRPEAGRSMPVEPQAAPESPAQRRQVGVIRISMPPRDGGVGASRQTAPSSAGMQRSGHAASTGQRAGQDFGRDLDRDLEGSQPGRVDLSAGREPGVGSARGYGGVTTTSGGGGRHARQQPVGGRRRADEGEGRSTSGRHTDRGWRTDDDLGRQRGGSFNQGRFA